MENWFIVLLVFQCTWYATLVESKPIELSFHDKTFVDNIELRLDLSENKSHVLLELMNRLILMLHDIVVPVNDASKTTALNPVNPLPTHLQDRREEPKIPEDINGDKTVDPHKHAPIEHEHSPHHGQTDREPLRPSPADAVAERTQVMIDAKDKELLRHNDLTPEERNEHRSANPVKPHTNAMADGINYNTHQMMNSNALKYSIAESLPPVGDSRVGELPRPVDHVQQHGKTLQEKKTDSNVAATTVHPKSTIATAPIPAPASAPVPAAVRAAVAVPNHTHYVTQTGANYVSHGLTHFGTT